ncbi:MAG: hypothetical protein AAGD25_00700 [Cyanobacteria bacterium P01_F01_bin.150]
MRTEIFDGSIIDRISQYVVQLDRPNSAVLKNILWCRLDKSNLNLEDIFSRQDLDDILNQPSIRAVINRAASYYRHNVEGLPLPYPASGSNQAKENLKASTQDNLSSRLNSIESSLYELTERIKIIEYFIDSSLNQKPLSKNPSSLDENIPLSRSLKTDRDTCLDPDIELVKHYLKTEKLFLTKKYSDPTIISASDDIGKLIAIVSELQTFTEFDIQELRLGKNLVLPDHILIQKSEQGNVLGFLHVGGNSFTSQLKNFNQLVISNKNLDFVLMRDERESNITGGIGRQEIEKLNHAESGCFKILSREDRIQLELLYSIIVAIQNRDLDIDIAKAIQIFEQQNPEYWLLEKLMLNS